MKSMLLAVSLSLLLVACRIETDTEPASTSSGAGNPPAAPIDSICGGGSLEGCFDLEGMGDYLDAVLPMIASYFDEEFADIADPRSVSYIPSTYAGRSECGVSNSFAYEYCPADQTIYIGQDLLWEFYDRVGDAAPAVGLAHEWGHHVQTSVGIFPRNRAEAIQFENQADCISGAWARHAEEQGWLETDDDLRDVQLMMEEIASAEGPNRDHGTAEEREDAFRSGFDKGISACNSYFKETPLRRAG